MEALFETLQTLTGRYVGRGVNHEGQPFTGILEMTAVTRGAALAFQAIGDDGTVFHEECSLIGPTLSGKPGLWVLSSNHPGVFERTLSEDSKLSPGGSTLVFAFGDKQDRSAFREEILMAIGAGRSIRYVYSWGMPGGEFAERSGVTLTRTN